MGFLGEVVGGLAPTLPGRLEVGGSFLTTSLTSLKAVYMFRYDLNHVKFDKKWRIALKLCQA